jgi:beta-lactamase class A
MEIVDGFLYNVGMNARRLAPWTLLCLLTLAPALLAFASAPGRVGEVRADASRSPVRPAWLDGAARRIGALVARERLTAAYVIVDLSTGHSASLNADLPMPAASLIKLPVMVATHQAFAAGWLSPAERLPILPHQISETTRMRTGDTCGVSTTVLLERMLTASDNTSTNVLVDRVGMSNVNAVCRFYGMPNTRMVRQVMDLRSRDWGIENYTTARDVTTLFVKLSRGEVVNPYWSNRMLRTLARSRMRDRIPKYLPENLPIAHKTGLMRDAMYDAGLLYLPGRTVAFSMLIRDYADCAAAKELIGRSALATYDAAMGYESSDSRS